MSNIYSDIGRFLQDAFSIDDAFTSKRRLNESKQKFNEDLDSMWIIIPTERRYDDLTASDYLEFARKYGTFNNQQDCFDRMTELAPDRWDAFIPMKLEGISESLNEDYEGPQDDPYEAYYNALSTLEDLQDEYNNIKQRDIDSLVDFIQYNMGYDNIKKIFGTDVSAQLYSIKENTLRKGIERWFKKDFLSDMFERPLLSKVLKIHKAEVNESCKARKSSLHESMSYPYKLDKIFDNADEYEILEMLINWLPDEILEKFADEIISAWDLNAEEE